MLIRLSVDEVMWFQRQSVNHQGLLCSLHCARTVVLREQLNFKSAVIRSERSSCLNSFGLSPVYLVTNCVHKGVCPYTTD